MISSTTTTTATTTATATTATSTTTTTIPQRDKSSENRMDAKHGPMIFSKAERNLIFSHF